MEITLWVTGKCNLRCKYCYVDAMKNTCDLSAEQIPLVLKFIEKNYHNEDIDVNFFGGEPLINFKFIEEFVARIDEIGRYNVRYFMTTNGLLLDKDKIEFIKKNNIHISLSLDGDEQTNDLNRVDVYGNGTFSRIKDAYYMLVSAGLKDVRVRGTITPETSKNILNSVKAILDIDEQIDAVLVPDYFSDKWTENLIEDLADKKRIIDNIEEYKNICVIGEKKLVKSRCSGGTNSFQVYVDGTIFPCSFVVGKQQFVIGSLTDGLDENKIKTLTCNYDAAISDCVDCDYFEFCMSKKCRYLNWSLTGDMNESSALVCQFENIKMQ